MADTELAGLPTHLYPLRPLHREALRTVIEGPAELAGIGVDEDLVTRLVADTDSGEALPLLRSPWPSSPTGSSAAVACRAHATTSSAECRVP